MATITSSGGGATHIAKVTGQLSSLSNNLSDILMVSGGGGGGILVGSDMDSGADAGGISGNGGNSGNQTTGYAFGQGESSTNLSSGGSGLYGGYESLDYRLVDMDITSDMFETYKVSSLSNSNGALVNFTDLHQYIGSDYCLVTGQQNKARFFSDNSNIKYYNNLAYSVTHEYIPIGSKKVRNISFKYKKPGYTSSLSEYILYVFISDVSSNGNEERTTIYRDEGIAQTDDWIEVNVDCDADANYIRFAAINGTLIIKDFKLSYEDHSVSASGGGAGSGYIGNSLVSNKKMVGYNVPTSDAESTKTESVNEASESPVSGKPKIGNGYARIKLLREPQEKTLNQIAKTNDYVNHKKVSVTQTTIIAFSTTFPDLSNYYLSDWVLYSYVNNVTYNNGEFYVPQMGANTYSNGIAIPVQRGYVFKITFDMKLYGNQAYSYNEPVQGFLELVKINNDNSVTRTDLLRICKPCSTYDPTNPSHRLVKDNDYHSYEFTFSEPILFDYIHINGSMTNCYVKNIKVTIV